MDETVGWVTTDQARTGWADAPRSPERLKECLQVAFEMCTAYAPVLAPETEVPARYREAQCLHARAIWDARRRGTTPDDGYDDGAFSLAATAPTLSAQIRQLLRPPTGIPGIA